MGLFSKWFGPKEREMEVYPDVPEGMKGVFMKGIGMHWAYGCKPFVEEALKNVNDVQDFKVVAPPKDHAFVIFDPERTNLDIIQEAIRDTGYDVKEVVEQG